MRVHVTPRLNRFHLSKDCYQLSKARKITEIDLAELTRAVPCKNCFTDAPFTKMARRYCGICNKTRVLPCPHNGGVPVYQVYATKYRSLLREPGDLVYRRIHVWPDRAHLFL